MTYCAPCLADLALVREAVTSVSGTAACVAHAVLLTHPGDTPQRRLARLSDLRAIAEGKLPTASPEDAPAIELLVQEYALAGAMDMTVPLTELAGDRTPRPPKSRRSRGGRDRDRDRDRGPDRGPRPGPTPGATASAEPDTAAAEPSGRNEESAATTEVSDAPVAGATPPADNAGDAEAPPVQPAFDVNPEQPPAPASAEGDTATAEPSGRNEVETPAE